MENNKPLIVTVVGVVVIIAIALIAVSIKRGGVGGPGTGTPAAPLGGDAFRPENADALATIEGGTREVVKETIATPGEGDAAVPANVAVPQIVVETGPSSFRTFKITASGNKYSPSTIVVNEGDVIDVELTAAGKEYDIFFPDFGVYKAAKSGEAVKLQFQGYPFGEYRFFCKEVCGSANVEGKLIVNKNNQ